MTTVIVQRRGHVGRITLNRPEALNALTLDMVREIDAALDEFAVDDAVATVVIDAAGDRAFCAGGDIRAIYDAALAGDPAPRTFWAEEYRLNSRIARFVKPVVTIMDGIVMGGGVGIAAHASHRIATERATIAMPEVGIGFAPDVGGTWLLSRAPGETGTHLALTAGRVGPADAIYTGVADAHVASSQVADLLVALEAGDVDEAVATHRREPPAGTLDDDRAWIDECYASDSVVDVLDRLRSGGDTTAQAAAQLAAHPPTSLAVTLAALRRARRLPSLEACLDMEYRISTTFLTVADFVEGIRAAVVDKDRNPRWDPADIGDVDADTIATFFAPRPDDLGLADQTGSAP